MKVRNALNVIRRWPPVWRAMGEDRRLLEGEVGVLSDAYSNREAESAIFLVIRRCTHKFMGVIFLKDCSCRTRMLSLLQANIGKPIREIGDLEL